MARKTQISEEMILQAAFQILIRDGYSAVSITSLAKEIGCSTQPIAWHFGNMEGLRTRLLEYCWCFLKDRFSVKGENAVEIVGKIAEAYVDVAFDYPHLYKYLYVSDQDGRKNEEWVRARRVENYEKILNMLEQECRVSVEVARRYLMDLQVYVHGIACFAVTKLPTSTKGDLMRMIREANEMFLRRMKETEK